MHVWSAHACGLGTREDGDVVDVALHALQLVAVNGHSEVEVPAMGGGGRAREERAWEGVFLRFV